MITVNGRHWSRWLVWFLLGTAAGCASLGGVLNTPSIEVLRVQTEWINPESVKFNLQLKISNPNPLTLSFSALAYTFTLEGREYAFRQQQGLPVVPGYTARLARLALTLDTPASWHDSSRKPKPLNIRVAGQYRSASHWLNAAVPFNQSFKLPARQLPEVILIEVLSSKKNRQTKLKFKLKNPNQTELRLSTVRGRLQTGFRGGKLLPLAEAVVFPASATREFELRLSPVDVSRLKPKTAYLLSGELEFQSQTGRMILPLKQKVTWPR